MVQGGLTWVDRGLSRPVRARGRKGRIGTRKRAFRGETLPTAPPTASCVSRKRRNPAIVALWTPDLFSFCWEHGRRIRAPDTSYQGRSSLNGLAYFTLLRLGLRPFDL